MALLETLRSKVANAVAEQKKEGARLAEEHYPKVLDKLHLAAKNGFEVTRVTVPMGAAPILVEKLRAEGLKANFQFGAIVVEWGDTEAE